MKNSIFFVLSVLAFSIACEPIGNEVRFNLQIDNEENISNSMVQVGDTLLLKPLSDFNMVQKQASVNAIGFPYSIVYESDINTVSNDLSVSYLLYHNEQLYLSSHNRGAEFDGELLATRFQDNQGLRRPLPSFRIRTNGQSYEWNSFFLDEEVPNTLKLIFAGDSPTTGAVMHQVEIEYETNGKVRNNGSNQEVDTFMGRSGNAVLRVGEYYYLAAGGSDRGGVYSYNISRGEADRFFSNTYIKFIATNGSNRLIALKGGPEAELFVFEIGPNGLNTNPINSIPLGAITPELGKNTIWLEGNTAFLAIGQQGLAIVEDIENSNSASYITGTREEACNAVTMDEEFIYLAYDQYVEFLDRTNYFSLGIIDFEDYRESRNDPRSINYVLAFNYKGQSVLAVADKYSVRILSLNE